MKICLHASLSVHIVLPVLNNRSLKGSLGPFYSNLGYRLPYIMYWENKVRVYQEWALWLFLQQKIFQFMEFFIHNLFLIFKHFSVSRIKQVLFSKTSRLTNQNTSYGDFREFNNA